MEKREKGSTASSNHDVGKTEIYIMLNDGLSLWSVAGLRFLISDFLSCCCLTVSTVLVLACTDGISRLEIVQKQSSYMKSCRGVGRVSHVHFCH